MHEVAGTIFFLTAGALMALVPLSYIYMAIKADTNEYALVTLFVMLLGGSGLVYAATLLGWL